MILTTTGEHASKCSTGEATRGHNRGTETIFNYAVIVDPEAQMEPRELVPTQDRLRPAEILSAAACRLTAADLGITSPSVAESAEQAKDDMVARKLAERAGIEDVLHREGILYNPMVASHFGSLHGDFDDWIKKLAKAVGRKRGWASRAVERQIRARLGACLARRAARMSLATFGQSTGEDQVILPLIEYDELEREADREKETDRAVARTVQAAEEGGEDQEGTDGDE